MDDPQPPKQPSKLGERALIREFARRIGPLSTTVGFGDDCAPLADNLVWTTDMLMDGVDFQLDRHDWEQVGYKSLAVSVSDCAAMGAVPVAALIAVALSNATPQERALALMDGALRCATAFGFSITGGDTNSWNNPAVIATTVAARLPNHAHPLLRSGAQPGDTICVTGPIGGSLLGRHLTPQPRVREALALRDAGPPSAAIDISDGLVIDLARICEASRCGARLDAPHIDAALHADAHRRATQTNNTPRHHGLYDGEDFELILTIPPNRLSACQAATNLLPIGQITDAPGIRLRNELAERELEIRGWEHLTDS